MSDSLSKIVLAYSGGLDTSAILCWLREQYQCEVVCFTADLGQPEEIESARDKAHALGVKEIFIENLQERFVRDFVFPMFRANTVYEGEYLLGTAIARPLIAQRLVEIARETGADAIAHGATAKGNDQLRFEFGVHALAPELKLIAPWREWSYKSRSDLLAYCKERNIGVDFEQGSVSPWSMDANLLHISYEGGALEDPMHTPPVNMWRSTKSIADATDKPVEISIGFEHGDAVRLNDKKLSPAELLKALNTLGANAGIGRLDFVENRVIGIKSRGCYETPGGTILLRAHRAIESLTLDRATMALKDEWMPRYAALIYDGYWWSPERFMMQSAIDYSQQWVSGTVHLSLCKGNIAILGRSSSESLYREDSASFESNAVDWSPADAAGYINIQSSRFEGVLHKRLLKMVELAANKKNSEK